MKLYHPVVTGSLRDDGVGYWIDVGDEQLVGDHVYVRMGSLLLDQRDDWHETRTAAMDEAAVRIEAIAAKLTSQAAKIRAEAARLRAQAAEADERYDRGLPPVMEVGT